MSQQELVKRLARTFDDIGIAYMLTGSQVSSIQGAPRSTHDIDVVASVRPTHIDALMRAFPSPEFYLEKDAVLDAINRRSMFNILEMGSGDKIDVWMLKDDDYDATRFSRRCEIVKEGVSFKISSPEDTILYKLKWAKQSGGSEKQTGDAQSVLELNAGALDEEYMDRWAAKLNVTELLEKIRKEANS